MAVVALCHGQGGFIAGPCLVHVVEHLIARGSFGEAARLRFVTRALLFALVPIKYAQRDADLKTGGVICRRTLIFAADGWIGGAVGLCQLDIRVGETDGLLCSKIVR